MTRAAWCRAACARSNGLKTLCPASKATKKRSFGTNSMAIADPKLFVDTIVGQRGLYDTPDIENFLRSMIVSRLTNVLGQVNKGRSFLDLPAMFNDLSAGSKAAIKDDFAA